ncbi:MAG: hypothetical protein FGF48_09395 [Candidatus Brockarchaeota archaeon]|nr:hypothetical protein [Candidatus Brockarchaeota archaeon]
MVREKFAKGTLGFGILVTLLFIVVFNLVAIFLSLYLLVSIMPILAGLVIGFYAKGGSVARGKAGFKGVFAATLILLLISAPLIIMAFSEIVALWTAIPLILLAFSPIVMGLLGFIGGWTSGMVIKLAKRPKYAEELPPPPPPST